MAIEKKWEQIPAVALSANGTADGIVTIPTTSGFKTKQKVNLKSNTQPTILVEVKRVLSRTQFIVGPTEQNLSTVTDISAYLVADSATVDALEQPRPSIPPIEHERAVYEEEPVVAKRVHMVDDWGEPYEVNNPFPVRLSDGSVNIGTVNAEVEVQLSSKDNYPAAGDVHDSVRIGDQNNEAVVNTDGSLNVRTTSGPPGNLIYDEAAGTINSAAYTQVYTYTSTDDKTRILSLECYCTTPATFSVKINGIEIRRLFTSPLERNVRFLFENGRPILSSEVLTVEVQVERFIWPQYGTFVSLEGSNL